MGWDLRARAAAFAMVLGVWAAGHGPVEGSPAASPAFDVSHLASHRAVYEVSLVDPEHDSGFTYASGRIVVEWQNTCSGYAANHRFVTEFGSTTGMPLLSDRRFSSFEAEDGETFQFAMENFINMALADGTEGLASRRNRAIRYDAPMADQRTLPDGVVFPTQHAIAIMAAAEEGATVVKRQVFDGSEDGSVFDSVAFIGRQHEPRGPEPFDTVNGAAKLGDMPYWPVTLSYFEVGDPTDLPSYEVYYHLYPNGVSDRLKLNYGTFELEADLAEIEFLSAPECS